MKFKNQEFLNEDINMDFNNFVDCNFNRCNMIYRGYGPIGMQGCSFVDVKWTFSDAAANTVNFMTSLYSGAGEGGRKLIEQTFENIKRGDLSKK